MEKSNYPLQSILIFIDDISITASEGIGNWWKEDTFPLSAYDLALIPSNEDDGTDFPQIPAVYWLAHCVKTAITVDFLDTGHEVIITEMEIAGFKP